MAAVNWKIPSLLAATLLAALGLQAVAIKLMMDSNSPSAETAAEVAHFRAAPIKPALPAAPAHVEPPPASAPPERAVEPVAASPKPAALVADPPHLAGSAAKLDAPHGEPSPEAQQPSASSPAAPPATAPASAPPHSPEAALLAAEAKPAPSVEKPSSPPVAAAPPAETAAASEPAAVSDLQDASWLKARDPKRYTVQLYSGKSLDTLRAIAAATGSTEPQAYYSTGSRSGPWYSLVAGDYSDVASAQAAAGKLTASAPSIKPWIRRFDEIQVKLR